ncbi:GAF domain-containing protein [uncultured Thermanaerothrix sp.]|uniref:GAF domain-containing protein n=1 Tax=uncultured Thermanaerothrix sp. TaxID=1195149 RepID=UPI00261323E2|nr:GAF domain-containing protein [uncultured Thermanaerothrix sp.]
MTGSYQGRWWSLAKWSEAFGTFLQDLAMAEDIDQAYGMIVSSALTLFGADGAILYPFSSDGSRFELDRVISEGLAEDFIFYHHEYPLLDRLPAQVLESGQVAVEDISKPIHQGWMSALTRQRLLGVGIRALVAQLLQFRGENLGVLYFNFSRPQGFSLEFLEWIRHFADIAATFLGRMQILEEQIAQYRKLKRYFELAEQIGFLTTIRAGGDLSVQHLLSLLVDRVPGLQLAAFYQRCDSPSRLELVGYSSQTQPASIQRNIPLSLELIRQLQEVYESTKFQGYHQELEEIGLWSSRAASFLNYPLCDPSTGDLLGLIHLESNLEQIFGPEDRHLLYLISIYLSNLFKYWQLYNKERRRAEQFKTILGITQGISALQFYRDVLQQIASHLLAYYMHYYPPEKCAIILFPYREDRQQWERPVIAGHLQLPERVESKMEGDTLLDKILKGGDNSHFTSGEASQDPLLAGGFVRREGIKASGFVRLRIGREIAGVLFVNLRVPHEFDSEEREFINLLANQASIAILNARQFEALSGDLDHLEAMLWGVLGHFESGSLRGELQAILEDLVHKEKYDTVSLHLYRPEAQQLDRPLLAGNFYAYVQAAGLDRIEGTVLSHFLPEGPAEYFSRDARHDPLLWGGFVEREKVASAAVLRLEVAGRIHGLLFVNSRHPLQFDEARKEALRQYAHRAARILDQAWLYRKDKQQLRLIARVQQSVTRTLCIEELFDLLKGAFKEIWGEDVLLSLWLPSKDRTLLEIWQPERSIEHIEERLIEGRVSIGDGSIIGKAAQSLQTQSTLPYSPDPTRIPSAWEGIVAEFAVPILLDSEDGCELVGVLDVGASAPGVLTEDDQIPLELLARQLGYALKNIRAYEESERMRKQLLGLYESVQALMTPLEKFQMLQRILRKACEMTGAHAAMLLRCEDSALSFEAIYPDEAASQILGRIGRSIPLSGKGITIEAARTGKVILVEDVESSALYLDGLGWRTRCEMAVPIVQNGQVISVFNIEHGEVGGLSERDQDVILALGYLSEAARQIADQANAIAGYQAQRRQQQILGRVRKRMIGHLERMGSLVGDLGGRLNNLKREIDRGRGLYLEREVKSAIRACGELFELLQLVRQHNVDEPPQEIEIVDFLRNRLRRWRVRCSNVEFDFGPLANVKPLLVKTIPSDLEWILDLLVQNSVNALRSEVSGPKRIWFQLEVEKADLYIKLLDSGPGIPEDLIGRLGSEMLRLRDERYHMGCYEAAQFAQDLGGEVTWQNMPGGGACATLRLPLSVT